MGKTLGHHRPESERERLIKVFHPLQLVDKLLSGGVPERSLNEIPVFTRRPNSAESKSRNIPQALLLAGNELGR